jgi:hypothetical protein
MIEVMNYLENEEQKREKGKWKARKEGENVDELLFPVPHSIPRHVISTKLRR